MSRSSRVFAVAVALCIIGVGATLWSLRSDSASGQEGRANPAEASVVGVRDQPNRSGSDRQASTREPISSEASERLEAILTNPNDGEAAAKLQELAGRNDLSLNERENALEHAILLTSGEQEAGLVALARKTSLPPELAGQLLADFHNRGDPARLAGAVALAKNDDASVREGAMELLRFLMDEGEEEGTDVEILEKAESRLPPQERE